MPGPMPPQQMPPGGSPTSPPMDAQGQGMPPEQAMQIMQKFGIGQQDVAMVQAAIESLEAAGMIPEGPEPAEDDQGPPQANSRLAQMLAG